jgi:hypothetical protein
MSCTFVKLETIIKLKTEFGVFRPKKHLADMAHSIHETVIYGLNDRTILVLTKQVCSSNTVVEHLPINLRLRV